MKKLLFILPMTPYINRHKSVYIYALKDAGVQVEFWDVSKITGFEEIYKLQGKSIFETVPIESFEELNDRYYSIDFKETLISVPYTDMLEMAPINTIVKNSEAKLIFFHVATVPFYIPSASPDFTLWNFSIKLIKKVIPQNLYATLRDIWRKLHRKPDDMNPDRLHPDVVFAAGKYALWPGHSQNIHCNSQDYENFVRDIDLATTNINSNVCVFLDEAFMHHPDNKIAGVNFDPRKAEIYYEKMVDFFEKIEKIFSVKVTIAAHPKAHYSGNEFGGRPIVKGDTLGCMRRARMALAHASTSCGMAAMFNIPLALVTFDLMHEYLPGYKGIQKIVANALGAKIIDLDNLPRNLENCFKIDKNAYERYLYSCCTWPEYRYRRSDRDVADFIKNCEAADFKKAIPAR